MTTNAIVAVDASDWVDLHAGASIASGTSIICQIKTTSNTNVVFVDQITKPTGTVDTAGGLETIGAKETVTATPDTSEVTWCRTRKGPVNVSVQDS